eukprot:7788224-Ditylum_brightwellii.AAC.1
MQNAQSDANLTDMASNDAVMSPSKTSLTTTTAGQDLDKTPIIPTKESPSQKTGKTTTINEHKLKITFLVGKNEDINPQEKFATLLSLLITCFPSLTLEEWGSTDADCAQSITTGANLPFKQKHLDKYCPHGRNKTHLVIQWLITSQSKFHEIKNNSYVISHLKKYQIFMNLTNVKAKRSRVLGFFVFSHGAYSALSAE